MSREQPEATKTRYSKCWNTGYDDYVAGHAVLECSYELGSDEHANWLKGWLDAHADLRL